MFPLQPPALCDPGHEDQMGKCEPCPLGFYKEERTALPCDQCPGQETTVDDAAVSSDECIREFYVTSRCTCNNMHTFSVAQTPSISSYAHAHHTHTLRGVICIVSVPPAVSCDEGTYDGGNQTCTRCAIGFYNDKKKQTSCEKCPEGTSTRDTGSEALTDCLGKIPVAKDLLHHHSDIKTILGSSLFESTKWLKRT